MEAYQSIKAESTQRQSIQAAVKLVSHWQVDLGRGLIFDSDSSEITRYLEATDKILQLAQVEEVKDLIFMVLARIKLEFEAILTRQMKTFHLYILKELMPNSTQASSSSTADSTSYKSWHEIDHIAYEVMHKEESDYLRIIAERLNSCGHLGACLEVYVTARKHSIASIMESFHLEELLAGNPKKLLQEVFQVRTNRWIRAATVCTKLLFPAEKRIANYIFGELGISSSIADESFMNVVKDAVVNLFSFAEAVSSSHQSSERLEITLNLYKALSSFLTPYMNDLFEFESAKGIRNRISAIVSGIQDQVRRMVSETENAVLCESSKISDKVVAVHSLTEFVMGYLNVIAFHNELFMSIIVSNPKDFPNKELQNTGNLSPLALHVVLIIEKLFLNLEDKSKKCKKPWFNYMFMVKNIQFITREIERSVVLQKMAGTDYLHKLRLRINQARDSFQALTCDLSLRLKGEDIYISWCFGRRVSTRALGNRMKEVNSLCKDMLAFRSLVEIEDWSLWEEIVKLSMEVLLPEYESFLKKFKNHLKTGKGSKLSIFSFRKIPVKYSVEYLLNAWCWVIPSGQSQTSTSVGQHGPPGHHDWTQVH